MYQGPWEMRIIRMRESRAARPFPEGVSDPLTPRTMTAQLVERKPGSLTHPGSKMLLLAVMFDVLFCCFRSMMGGMLMVSTRNVGMVRGFLVSAGFMVLCRFLMMMSGVLVMLSGFFVMFCCLF